MARLARPRASDPPLREGAMFFSALSSAGEKTKTGAEVGAGHRPGRSGDEIYGRAHANLHQRRELRGPGATARGDDQISRDGDGDSPRVVEEGVRPHDPVYACLCGGCVWHFGQLGNGSTRDHVWTPTEVIT